MKPRFILYKDRVLDQYEEVSDFCDKVVYSYKTNEEVGSVLEEETSCDFSIHSLNNVRELDDPSRVWFFPQGWDEDELNELLSLGVDSFVVDNQNDLDVLLENAKGDVNVLLRMRLKEHSLETGKRFVYGFSSSEINSLLNELSEEDFIDDLGVHVHRKTQNVAEWDLVPELREIEEDLDEVDIINIGGGLPVDYKNYREDVIPTVFEKVDKVYSWLSDRNVEVIAEPGRFIAAPSVELECHVRNVYDNNILVDCSVYKAAMDTFINNIRLKVKGEVSEEEGMAYTIKGITPDSLDILRYKVYFSGEPERGDKITLLNAGAYNFYSDFCGLSRVQTELR